GLAAWRSARSERGAVAYSLLDAGIVMWVVFLLVGTMSPSAPTSTDTLNLVPFNYFLRGLDLGGVDLRNSMFDVVANVAVFVPLGLLIGFRFERPALLEWTVGIACLMIAIEVAQAYVLRRSGDITDVITNTIGAGLGLALGRALRRRAYPTAARELESST
ncbi:MAG TPA: VanZ family protein, partial [Candidatus Limnocylindrales bacterium]|nr:VanZ family protein [Candidatus Limnocylindrales bacterium]